MTIIILIHYESLWIMTYYVLPCPTKCFWTRSFASKHWQTPISPGGITNLSATKVINDEVMLAQEPANIPPIGKASRPPCLRFEVRYVWLRYARAYDYTGTEHYEVTVSSSSPPIIKLNKVSDIASAAPSSWRQDCSNHVIACQRQCPAVHANFWARRGIPWKWRKNQNSLSIHMLSNIQALPRSPSPSALLDNFPGAHQQRPPAQRGATWDPSRFHCQVALPYFTIFIHLYPRMSKDNSSSDMSSFLERHVNS